MASPSSLPVLDHIVILVSHATLVAADKLLQDHFVVIDGGAHAGGLTNNRLILLTDGVYIELIAFSEDADPETRKRHRWGNSRENSIVDFGYTLPREEGYGAVQERVREARAGITYADLVPGGRTRPDGVVLQWSIGAAQDADGREARPGSVPFWCLDRTSRALRVPYEEHPEHTQHPSGVRGVSRLRVSERQAEIGAVSSVCDAIHAVDSPERVWGFRVPREEEEEGGPEGHTLSVSAAADGQTEIRLALRGSVRGGPASIELFPGLVVDVDR